MRRESLTNDRPVPAWRLLIWLKWRLALQARPKNRIAFAAVILSWVVFGVLSVGYAAGLYYLLSNAPSQGPPVFNAVLGGIYLIWIVAPLFGVVATKSYDPQRLFVYPVSYRTIFACTAAGGLVAVPVIMTLPLLAVIAASAAHGIAGALLAAVVLVLFLAQASATSCMIVLALLGVLTSRRMQDVVAVVGPLLGIGFYVGQNSLIRRYHPHSMNAVLSDLVGNYCTGPLWTAASYLPSGWSARALSAIDGGRMGEALLWTASLIALLALVTTLGGWLMRGLALGERDALSPRQAEHVEKSASAPSAARSLANGAVLSPGISAVLWKDLCYFAREPIYKALLVNALYMICVIAMPFLGLSASRHRVDLWDPNLALFRKAAPFAMTIFGPTAFTMYANNMLGGEGAAITVLLTFPTPRREIVIGKTLAYAAVLLPFLLIVMIVVSLLCRVPEMLGLGVVWVLTQVAVSTGVASVLSALFPFPRRQAVRGVTYQQIGCGTAFLRLLAAGVALVLLLIPAGMLVLSVWLDALPWTAALVALTLLYATGVFIACMLIAANVLETRAPEIIERLTATEG
ncbi:MAG: hypothetical protein P4L33_02235 [Capsulimonadaceae bacterium]|nr:hypothetical protein [Capsulimonadaceae bacterium]